MKIYNKRGFIEGAFMLALAVLNLILGIMQHDLGIKDGILCAVLFVFGGILLARSLSQSASRQDKIDAMDERNRTVKQKASSRAFSISRFAYFVLILLCAIAYAATDNRDFIGIIIGLALAWGIALLTDLFSYIYYDSQI